MIIILCFVQDFIQLPLPPDLQACLHIAGLICGLGLLLRIGAAWVRVWIRRWIRRIRTWVEGWAPRWGYFDRSAGVLILGR